jgi:hypothetical protein
MAARHTIIWSQPTPLDSTTGTPNTRSLSDFISGSLNPLMRAKYSMFPQAQ